MRDDAGHGHCQRFVHVHQGRAVLEDGRDELVGQRPVRAAVTARGHAGRQSRPAQVGQVLQRPWYRISFIQPFSPKTRPVSMMAPCTPLHMSMREQPDSLVSKNATSS